MGRRCCLVFLLLGLVAGGDGLGGIAFDDTSVAFFIGSLALALILFEAGFETRRHTLRGAAGQALVLATVGVVITAGDNSRCRPLSSSVSAGWRAFLSVRSSARPMLPPSSCCSGSAASPSASGVRATLEIESGSNDPMAILPDGGVGRSDRRWFRVRVRRVMRCRPTVSSMQMGLGIGVRAGRWRCPGSVGQSYQFRGRAVSAPGLWLVPSAFSGLTGLAGGSGFLAVYIAGLWVGNAAHAAPDLAAAVF